MDGEWVDDDEEMIDDFVILEPPNFDKYNNTESLQKEKDKKVLVRLANRQFLPIVDLGQEF